MDDRNEDEKLNSSNLKEVVHEKFESWKAAGQAVRKLLSSVNRNKRHSRGLDKGQDLSSSDAMNEMLQHHENSFSNNGSNNGNLSHTVKDVSRSLDCEIYIGEDEKGFLSSPGVNKVDVHEVHTDSLTKPVGNVKRCIVESAPCNSLQALHGSDCYRDDNTCDTLEDSMDTNNSSCCKVDLCDKEIFRSHSVNCVPVKNPENGKARPARGTYGLSSKTDPQDKLSLDGATFSQVKEVDCLSRTGYVSHGNTYSESTTNSFVQDQSETVRPVQDNDTKRRWNMLKEKIKRLTGKSPGLSSGKQKSVTNKCDEVELQDQNVIVDYHSKSTAKERRRITQTTVSLSSDSSDAEDSCIHRYSYVRKKTNKLRKTSLSKQKKLVLPAEKRGNVQCDECCSVSSKDLAMVHFTGNHCGPASSPSTFSTSYQPPTELSGCDKTSSTVHQLSSQSRHSLNSFTDCVPVTLGNNFSETDGQNDAVSYYAHEQMCDKSGKENSEDLPNGILCTFCQSKQFQSDTGLSLNDLLRQCYSDNEQTEKQQCKCQGNWSTSIVDGASLPSSNSLKQLHNLKASVEKLLQLNENIDNSRPQEERLGLGSLLSEDNLRCTESADSEAVKVLDEIIGIEKVMDVPDSRKTILDIPNESDVGVLVQDEMESYVSTESSQQSQLLDELQERVAHLLQCNALRIGRLQLRLEESNCGGGDSSDTHLKPPASEGRKLREFGSGRCVAEEDRESYSSPLCGSSSGEETDEEDNTLPDGLPTLVSSSEDEGKPMNQSLTPVNQSPCNIKAELLESPDSLLISYDSDLGQGLCDLDLQPSTEEDEPKVLISPREMDSLPELISSSNNSPYGSEADDEFECDCSVCLTGKPHIDGDTAGFIQKDTHTIEEETSTDTDVRRELNQSQEYLVEYLPPEEYFEAETDLLLQESDDPLANNLFTSSVEWELPLSFSVNDLNPLDLLMTREGIWDVLAFMFQNVIRQMLSVYPDLLSDRAPPPLTPDLINIIPVVSIDQTKIAEDPRCPICLCEFELGEEARELTCHHTFHILCIAAWLAKSATCPVCRDIVRPETYQPH